MLNRFFLNKTMRYSCKFHPLQTAEPDYAEQLGIDRCSTGIKSAGFEKNGEQSLARNFTLRRLSTGLPARKPRLSSKLVFNRYLLYSISKW